MKNIKHIFFDLDNTLWDYKKNAKLALETLYNKHKAEENYGYTFEEFYPYYEKSNARLWELMSLEKIDKEELRNRRFPDAFREMGIKEEVPFALEFEEEFVNSVTNNHYMVSGAEEILKYLHKKYSLHILTNGFQDVSERKINGCIIKDYIQTMTTAEEAGVPKPNKKVFEYALNKAKAQKAESIYVGDDWVADMVGATDFGIKAVFFNPKNNSHEEFPKVLEINKLVELKELF